MKIASIIITHERSVWFRLFREIHNIFSGAFEKQKTVGKVSYAKAAISYFFVVSAFMRI